MCKLNKSTIYYNFYLNFYKENNSYLLTNNLIYFKQKLYIYMQI